jgi:hypothetical protein
MQRKLYRGDHPELAITLQNLASVLTRLKRLSESEPLYRESLRMARATLGVSHPTTTLIAERVAQFLDETGRTGEAAQLRAEFGVSPSTIAPATAPATTRS